MPGLLTTCWSRLLASAAFTNRHAGSSDACGAVGAEGTPGVDDDDDAVEPAAGLADATATAAPLAPCSAGACVSPTVSPATVAAPRPPRRRNGMSRRLTASWYPVEDRERSSEDGSAPGELGPGHGEPSTEGQRAVNVVEPAQREHGTVQCGTED